MGVYEECAVVIGVALKIAGMSLELATTKPMTTEWAGYAIAVHTDRPFHIDLVALLRAGSTTYHLNTDQCYAGMSITQRGTSSIIVKAPLDGA